MAIKSKKGVIKIKLNSTGTLENGEPTGIFYTTTKNTKNTSTAASTKKNRRARTASDKIRLRKYDRRAWNAQKGKAGMHVWFEEGKIK